MVLARVANLFTDGGSTSNLVQDGWGNDASTMQKVESRAADAVGAVLDDDIDDEAARPPYLHVRRPRQHEQYGHALTFGRQCWQEALEAPPATC